MNQSECMITRAGRTKPIDLRANLVALEIEDGQLRIEQTTSAAAMASPRDVLNQLGLTELEKLGHHLTRTQVQLVAT